MSRFDTVLDHLKSLQSHLKVTGNRLWTINLAISQCHKEGHEDRDFLPRRLIVRRHEEQIRFDHLLQELNLIISSHLDSALIVFSSEEDVDAAAGIRQTIRYIQNAFAGELSLHQSLTKISMALPAGSKN